MGFPESEVTGRKLVDFFPEHSRPAIEAAVEKVLTGQQSSFDTIQILPDRPSIIWNAILNPIYDRTGKINGFVGIFSDITERKSSEEALLDSEEKYRTLFDSASDAIFIIDAESSDAGRIISANNAAARMHGYTIEELTRMRINDLDTPESSRQAEERIRRLLSGGQLSFEVRHVRKDGSVFPVEVNAGLITIKGHRYVLAFDRDIAERKLALESLSLSEKKFRDLLETIRLLSVMLDCDGNITFCNDYLLTLTGWSREEVLGKNWFEIFIPENLRSTLEQVFSNIISGSLASSHYENNIITRDGASRLIVWDNTMLHNLDGAVIGTASIGVDITEHRRLEEQLRQSQKLEAIGQLAGGVAHDFNNILSAIMGYAHLTNAQLGESGRLKNYLDQIIRASEKATNLTQSLLSFSRKQIITPKPVNLNEIIKQHKNLLSRLIREDIDITVNYSKDDLVILADKGQIEQILMNLVTNARDAMPNGGRIIIETCKARLDQSFVDTHGYGEIGDYSLIMVSDNGQGMDERTKEKIFEPFFTTKEQGKGTGLGLSTVYGIIKQHSGYINVYSEPSLGTTFKIYLPLMKQAEVEDRETTTHLDVVGGTETILLAEDDISVRDLTSTILQNYGYRVIEAVDGQDAVSKYAKNSDRVALVILDGIMPKKNGREAYEEMLAINPAIKTIFLSGYAEDIIGRHGLPDQSINFILKPVSPTNLLKRIREVLEKK